MKIMPTLAQDFQEGRIKALKQRREKGSFAMTYAPKAASNESDEK